MRKCFYRQQTEYIDTSCSDEALGDCPSVRSYCVGCQSHETQTRWGIGTGPSRCLLVGGTTGTTLRYYSRLASSHRSIAIECLGTQRQSRSNSQVCRQGCFAHYVSHCGRSGG